ncbi:MAG: Sugar phosphate isomerase/epimerase [Segetibacter sp.]|nr:Sugar phosphate isomerase/epimerase [Segetibacter sp.]
MHLLGECMKIKFFCPRWGAEHIAWSRFLQTVKQAGYAGIEWFPYAEIGDYIEVVKLLEENELDFTIVMAVIERIDDFTDYLKEFEKQLLHLSQIQTSQKRPLHITAQTGREFYTEQQVDECLLVCRKITQTTGIPIYQETHRNKWAYAAHVVHRQLQKHPDLELTLDVSHWFCVSESYLQDQQVAVDLAIKHAKHIHARIGHTQGPQVWEPASDEYAEALNEHLKIWDKWIITMKHRRSSFCTITPEFGPPPYLVFANRHGTPFDEQFRLNLWMKNLLEKRYTNY